MLDALKCYLESWGYPETSMWIPSRLLENSGT